MIAGGRFRRGDDEVGVAAEVSDEGFAVAGRWRGVDGGDADGGAVPFDGYLGVGQEAGAGALGSGDGGAAFDGDAHGVIPWGCAHIAQNVGCCDFAIDPSKGRHEPCRLHTHAAMVSFE